MTEPVFDPDRLDVYPLAIDCVASSFFTDGLNDVRHSEPKAMLKQIVSMLTRLIARADAVSESPVEYEYESRGAEYECDGADKPEPCRAPERRQRVF